MDTPVQPSFIPKKPLTGTTVRGGSAAMGMLFVLIATLIFVASLVAAGGAYVYKKYLAAAIIQKSDTLEKTEAAFDPATIQDLMRLDLRINNAEALMQKHVTTLAIFSFLSQQTLQKVQFTTFSYSLQDNGIAQISLNGVADGFATVALQSDQFSASKILKDVVFSGVAVGAGGNVVFNVHAQLDPSLTSYAKNLSGSPAADTGSQQPTTATMPDPATLQTASPTLKP